MRVRHVALFLASVWVLAGSGLSALDGLAPTAPAEQDKRSRRRLTPPEREVGAALVAMADAVVKGEFAGGDAWLKWQCHFLRAPDGRTYVPFTVEVDEAPEGFRSVAMYVRVTRAGDTLTSTERARQKGHVGFRSGEVPISVPERQFVPPGTATAGEASAALQMLTEMLASDQLAIYPFEDFHFFDLPEAGRGERRLVQRAAVVPAGRYDVYVAIRERGSVGGELPRSAILKRTIEVPDFSRPELSMSSVILADKLDVLDAPLSAEQQVERPYALGTAEIVPALDTLVGRDEALTLAFLVYGAAADAAGKPDVTVDYVFYQQIGVAERPFTRTRPQQFDATTLPATFDLNAGHQLATSQSVPLEAFPPGAYRLEITLTDAVTSAVVKQDLRFTVVESVTTSG